MTLSKQLLALISMIFLLIYSVNFIISVNNIRDYLEIESEIHAQDTATSLGLSLSPHMSDESDPIIETMMNAIFDVGYYKEIKLLNAENKTLLVLSNNTIFTEVPTWFIEYIPMQTATAKTEINSGWSIAGELFVTINPGYGYLKLYEQAKSSLYYSLVAFVISMLLLFLVLRFTLSPLKKIEALARTIANAHFSTIEHLPWTTEVKNVAIAMNAMSKKIKTIINNLNVKLESISSRLQLDDLTGLNKKDTFITDLKQLFMKGIDGHIFLIKLDMLGKLARQEGNPKADEFLIEFANILKAIAQSADDHETSVYRFYGSEFAMISTLTEKQQINSLGKILSAKCNDLGQIFQMDDITHIGIAPFNQFSSIEGVLAASQEAYEQARLVGNNGFFLRRQSQDAKSIEDWKKLVANIIDQRQFSITMIGQAERLIPDLVGDIVMEEAFLRVVDEKNAAIPIGTFISVAEKHRKAVDLDKAVTESVLQYILEHQMSHAITINLSLQSVRSAEFRSWLTKLIKKHPLHANSLTFSLTAYTAAKDTQNFKEFIRFIHEIGAKVILKRYETRFIDLQSLKEFNLDYIRLARELTTNISSNPGKQNFLQNIQELGELLDIKILAEQVMSDADYALVKSIKIYAASR